MVVFTAKVKATNEVFVGSARDCVEEHWAQLIVLAEEGGSGKLLDVIREHGASGIEVETWGYGDSPAESREIMREACDQLGATIIKTGRVQVARVATTPSSIDEQTPPLSVTQRIQEAAKKIQVQNVTPQVEQKSKEKPAKPSQTEHGPVVSIDINAYQAQQAKIEDKQTAANPVNLRHTESTSIADDMKSVMVKIEMQRKQNREKNSPTKKKTAPKKKVSAIKSSTTKLASVASLKTSSKKLKLPDGRVSSSVKEKKIKEAIAQEKMEREAVQRAKALAEADEMAALLAKLDERTREKGKLMRRR